MICPKCSSPRLTIPSTRPEFDDKVRRRRFCKDCWHRWFTIEMAEEDIVLTPAKKIEIAIAPTKAARKKKKEIDARPVTTKITPVENDYTARIMAKLDSRPA